MKSLTTLQQTVAIAGIRSAKLRKVGLMPAHDQKGSRIMAAVPIDPTGSPNEQLTCAVQTAVAYWPDCDDWSLGECDTTSWGDSIPPGFIYMHQPGTLCSFSTSGDTGNGNTPAGL